MFVLQVFTEGLRCAGCQDRVWSRMGSVLPCGAHMLVGHRQGRTNGHGLYFAVGWGGKLRSTEGKGGIFSHSEMRKLGFREVSHLPE